MEWYLWERGWRVTKRRRWIASWRQLYSKGNLPLFDGSHQQTQKQETALNDP